MANSKLEAFRSLHAVIELCKEQMHDDLVEPAHGVKTISPIILALIYKFATTSEKGTSFTGSS